MQTTLLGLAVAVILALLAALVGPLFIDWNQYRSSFEAEASRLLGQPVRVTGAIDARLLPTPSLVVNGLEIGRDRDRSTDSQLLRVRSVGIEFALGALMRGQLRASQMQVAGPELTLGLDNSGKLALSGAPTALNVDDLAIDRLVLEDGRVVLSDAASRSRLVLEKLWFNGDVRSLAGPFKGEGAFLTGGALYGYRLSTARAENGALRLKLNLDPADRPLAVEADGALSFDNASPRFEGALSLARPVGTVLSDGKTLVSEPWRATARVKAGAASALFEQIAFQYGPDDRAMKASGTAEFKFGGRPRFEGVLSSRQFDFDRMIATPETPKQLPFAALKIAMDKLAGDLRLPFPAQVGLSIDTFTLGGAYLQNLRGDLKVDGVAWSLDGLEFRAPGLTQVQLSGRLDLAQQNFAGPADINAADSRAFFAWLEGRGDVQSGLPRPMRMRGEVALGSGRVAVERLKAEVDRKAVEGRLAYIWPKDNRPARLEAEINAAEIDIDSMVAFGKTAFLGTTIDQPGEVALALAIGRATVAGVEARNAQAKLRYDSSGLHVERLSVADLGGTALNANGRIDTSGALPRGSIMVDLAARDLTGATALLGQFVPQGERFRKIAELPARLRATLDVDGAEGARANAKVSLDGSVGTMKVGLTASLNGDPSNFSIGDVKLDGRLAADDGAMLLAMLGLDRVVAAEKRPQAFSLAAAGPFNGDIRIDGRLAGEVEAAVNGIVRITGDLGASGTLNVSVGKADLRRLRPTVVGKAADPLPATLAARVAINGNAVMLNDLSATFAGVPVKGRLGFDLGPAPRVDGKLETDAIDAAALLASAFGMPPQPGNVVWSAEPFAQGLLPSLDGTIEVAAARASVTPTLNVKDFRTTLGLSAGAARLEDLRGEVAGGKLGGQLVFRRSADGLLARGRVSLTGADAAAILPGDGRTITGRLNLQVEAEGGGLSPRALMGSLAGNGMITIEKAQIAGLDPKSFASVQRAVDQGLGLDVNKIRTATASALDAGRLSLPQIDAAITVAGGQARIGTVIARGEGADLSASGNLELADNALEARLTLISTTAGDANIGRPEIAMQLKGPLASPARTIDVAALAGWLALRTVEQQSKKLEEAERLAAQRAREEAERIRREEIERQARAKEEAERQARLRDEERLHDEAARAAYPVTAMPPVPHLQQTIPLAPPPSAAPSTTQSVPAATAREMAPSLPPPIEVRPTVGDTAPVTILPAPRPRPLTPPAPRAPGIVAVPPSP